MPDVVAEEADGENAPPVIVVDATRSVERERVEADCVAGFHLPAEDLVAAPISLNIRKGR